jgi:hypothetical protein
MVNKKTTAGKKDVAKLKVKKETIKDLDVKGKVRNVKGGGVVGGLGNTAACLRGSRYC